MSPHKEELALVQESRNMQLPGVLVRKEIKTGPPDVWSEVMRSDELNCLDDGEAEGGRQPGEARTPSAQEHGAEEHGLPEADHRAT